MPKKLQEELHFEEENFDVKLEDIDHGIGENPAIEEEIVPVPLVIPVREITVEPQALLIDKKLSARMLADGRFRQFRSCATVVFMGQGEQPEFITILAANAVAPGGRLIFPIELVDRMQYCSGMVPGNAEGIPDGFVVYNRIEETENI